MAAFAITPMILAIALGTGEEYRVMVGSDGVELGATVTVPRPISAAAVLLPVAGPTDRDLSLGSKRFYADLAASLAEAGIATIRFDDRGVGDSGGNWMETGFGQRSRDACAALEFLAARTPDVQTLGYIGMSEGGGVGAHASATCGQASFVVLLSTPTLPGRKSLESQFERALSAMAALSNEDAGVLLGKAKRMLDLATSDSDNASSDLKDLLAGPYGTLLLPPYYFVPSDIEGKVRFLRSPWYRSQIEYDIAPALRRSTAQLLAIYGELDQVVEPQAHLQQLKTARSDAAVSLFPNLNHLLQTAKTGSPAEHAYLEGTISSVAKETVIGWINSVASGELFVR